MHSDRGSSSGLGGSCVPQALPPAAGQFHEEVITDRDVVAQKLSAMGITSIAVRLPMKTDKEKAVAAIVKLFKTCRSVADLMNWAVPDKFVESEANICYYEATIQKALEDNNTAQQAEAFLFQQVALPNGVGLTREAYADLSVAEKDRYLAPFVDFMKTEVAFAASALKAYAAAVGNPYLEGHFVGVLFRKVD